MLGKIEENSAWVAGIREWSTIGDPALVGSLSLSTLPGAYDDEIFRERDTTELIRTTRQRHKASFQLLLSVRSFRKK